MMKYIKEYMEEYLKLKPLGDVTFDEISSHDNEEAYGYEIIIDGRDTGLQIWWVDYATWLENKFTKPSTDSIVDAFNHTLDEIIGSRFDMTIRWSDVFRKHLDKYAQASK